MADSLTSVAFWILLLQIGYLNLLLSGDNALVIALAVRALPRHKRVLGQLWGAAGAVVLRLLFLGIVMYLLEVPFLKLVGGLLLIWIAFKLVQSESGAESEVKHGTSLWDAVWIIIVADVTMSLDNVLAIAAAARGEWLLVALGIATSIPVVVWGSGILARLMNRFAWIIWVGGGILGYVAGQMIIDDPIVAGSLGRLLRALEYPLPMGLGAALIGLGWWSERQAREAV